MVQIVTEPGAGPSGSAPGSEAHRRPAARLALGGVRQPAGPGDPRLDREHDREDVTRARILHPRWIYHRGGDIQRAVAGGVCPGLVACEDDDATFAPRRNQLIPRALNRRATTRSTPQPCQWGVPANRVYAGTIRSKLDGQVTGSADRGEPGVGEGWFV